MCHVTATLHTLRGAMCHEVTYPVKLKREGRKERKGEKDKKREAKGKDKCWKSEEAQVAEHAQGSIADDSKSCSISEPDS